MENRTEVEFSSYKRKEMYEFFSKKEYPVFTLTSRVDLTLFREFQQKNKLPFFISLSYILSLVVNEIPEFKHRIIAEKLFSFQNIDPGFTIAREDHSFGFGFTAFTSDFLIFEKESRSCLEFVKAGGVFPDKEDIQQSFFITTIPWVDFTSFTHPFDAIFGSIPIVTLGKMQSNTMSSSMPIALQVHHGIMDGYHAGLFYTLLQEKLNTVDQYILG